MNQVTPANTTYHRLMTKLLCFGCCFGYGEFHNNVVINTNNRNRPQIDIKDTSPCMCCWCCGFCQYYGVTTQPNETIETDKGRGYYVCCFCWDFEQKSYCCFVPLNVV